MAPHRYEQLLMSGAIQQSGVIVPGHPAVFAGNGIVRDGGPAGAGGSATTTLLPTVAALRASTRSSLPLPATIVFVLGYYAEGDGGGGLYTTGAYTPDQNGGTIINDSAGRSWYLDAPTGPISALVFGAAPNATDNTAAFLALEASPFSTAYLPDGNYAVNLTKGSLKKLYTGSGTIAYMAIVGGVFQNIAEGTTPHCVERTRSNPLAWPGANLENNLRTYVFIGDSITAASTTGYSAGYVALLQQKLATKMNEPVSSLIPFADFNYCSQAGTITQGTTGPVNLSVILQPGAVLQFTADYVDFVFFYYAQNPTTAGVITITDSFSGVSEVVTTTTGTDLNASGGTLPTRRCGAGVTFDLTCSVAPVEINGIFVSHQTLTEGILLQVLAYPGYATANFANAQTLTAIQKQSVAGASNNIVYVLAVGTNDIFAPSVAVTPAQYIANLTTICGQLVPGTPGSTVILTVPMMPYGGSATPIVAPFEEYRTALYQFARANGFDVVDLSELDMDTSPGLMYSDGLHPSPLGMRLLADYWWEKLHFDGITLNEYTKPITPAAGWSQYGNFSPLQTTVLSGHCYLSGVFATPGSEPGLPANMGTIDQGSANPVTEKAFACAAAGPAQVAVVNLTRAGELVINSISGTAWPQFVSLDGLSYSLKS
jgi:lysophospholipase L1-like esterase